MQSGFLLVTAIFLLVILAALGAFILTISGTQQTSSALDVQGSRAYQAARAGIEWASYQLLQGGVPCGPGYSYGRAVTIDHTKVPNTDQSNFPILFSGTYAGGGGSLDLRTVANGGKVQNSSGFDIIFNSDIWGVTKLDHEIESYNAATGAVNFWVRVPTVSHTADTVIYLCYGNPAISTSQENKTGVWDINFRAVWHLKESGSGTAGEFKDSTSNANNGRGGGGWSTFCTSSPTQAAAKIGNGQNYNGSVLPYGQCIEVPDNAILNVTTQVTMEAWVNLPSPTTNQKIVGKAAQAVPLTGYLLGNQTGGLYPEVWDTTGFDSTFTSGGTLTANTWTHLAVAYTVSGNMIGYINGVQVNSISASASNISTSPNHLRIGVSPWDNPQWQLTGLVDEVRISGTARSADWIKTEYNNENSPSTFYSIGAENVGGAFAAACNAGPTSQNVTGMGGTLSGFTAAVTCSSNSTTEGGATRTVYQITSTGSKGTAGTLDGVERQLQVTLIK